MYTPPLPSGAMASRAGASRMMAPPSVSAGSAPWLKKKTCGAPEGGGGGGFPRRRRQAGGRLREGAEEKADSKVAGQACTAPLPCSPFTLLQAGVVPPCAPHCAATYCFCPQYPPTLARADRCPGPTSDPPRTAACTTAQLPSGRQLRQPTCDSLSPKKPWSRKCFFVSASVAGEVMMYQRRGGTLQAGRRAGTQVHKLWLRSRQRYRGSRAARGAEGAARLQRRQLGAAGKERPTPGGHGPAHSAPPDCCAASVCRRSTRSACS